MTTIPTPFLSREPGRLAGTEAGTMLRWIVRADALVSGANGLAYLVGADALDEVLGLPASFLRGVGAFLLLFAATVWVVGGRTPTAVPGVREIIAANVLWTVSSVGLVLSGAADLTTAGAAWIVVQAGAVLALAGAQAWALRRVTDA
jgi:hypothetical protein